MRRLLLLTILPASLAVLSLVGLAAERVKPDTRALHRCTRVIDGDTIEVVINIGNVATRERVRLAGIDAPERDVSYAAESTAWLRNVLEGEEVTLEYLVGDAPSRDRYGRILAYVYRADPAFDVCLESLRQGYSVRYLSQGHRRADEFTAAETAARDLAHGLHR